MFFSAYILVLATAASLSRAAPQFSAPYQLSEFQSHRRSEPHGERVQDLQSLAAGHPARRAYVERAISYSVVPVNGEPAPTSVVESAAPMTVVETTTVAQSTVTAVITQDQPQETVFVTTTPKAFTKTIVTTIKATQTASTSTKYYDDGMWHTFYPVKEWTTSVAPLEMSFLATPTKASTPALASVDSTTVSRRTKRSKAAERESIREMNE